MLYRLIIRITAILFLFGFSGNGFALNQPAKKYDVQILIFSHLTANTLQTEKWPALSPSVLAEFNHPAQPTQLSQKAWQLQREKNALQKNPHYSVLFDGSFQCAWQDNTSIVTLPISTGSELNGTISIELDHYFNVHAHLLLTEPTTLLEKIDATHYFEQWNQPTFHFQFFENRRMRSDELNYLGHPLMGVLIKIISVKN